jgi:hypothetical protein
MDTCHICSSVFNDSPDDIILCKYREGIVHYGCCVDLCSLDKKPCANCVAQYKKV